jgi:hypothetical protein
MHTCALPINSLQRTKKTQANNNTHTNEVAVLGLDHHYVVNQQHLRCQAVHGKAAAGSADQMCSIERQKNTYEIMFFVQTGTSPNV